MTICSILREIYSQINFGGIIRRLSLQMGRIFLLHRRRSSLVPQGRMMVCRFVYDVDEVRHDLFLTNHFTVGAGGTIPANTTGNNLASGNSSDVTAGMYDCTALKYARSKVTAGVIGTYAAGIIFTAIVMIVVRGKDTQY